MSFLCHGLPLISLRFLAITNICIVVCAVFEAYQTNIALSPGRGYAGSARGSPLRKFTAMLDEFVCVLAYHS
jgi:hypothetical protein